MAELLDESSSIESTTVGINRTSATVKGGRRFSFSALVVVGDRHGRVGLGYGKANQVPQSIEKAQKEAKRKMRAYPLQGQTIPHQVDGRFGACGVRLVPASPGTGITAGSAVRAVLEMFGVKDCLTKCYGSTNKINLVKATIEALSNLRRREEIEALRGVELGESAVESMVRRGMAFMPVASGGERAAAPVNVVGDDRRSRGPRRGGPRRGGRGESGSGGGGAPASQSSN
jgi:small subunit ribosomal protein S5